MSIGRGLIALTLCSCLSACLSAEDRHQQAVDRGHVVAERWCSDCHRISRDRHGLQSPVSAPSFMEVADRPNLDRAYLTSLAHEFYFPMPAFRLPQHEQDDVTTYILSLKGQL